MYMFANINFGQWYASRSQPSTKHGHEVEDGIVIWIGPWHGTPERDTGQMQIDTSRWIRSTLQTS